MQRGQTFIFCFYLCACDSSGIYYSCPLVLINTKACTDKRHLSRAQPNKVAACGSYNNENFKVDKYISLTATDFK